MNELLQGVLNRYLEIYPDERKGLARLARQLADGEKMNDRRNWHGHIAGSGLVLSEDRTKILLIDHKTFQRWMQPGGHWESDDEVDPLEVAKREVREETGTVNLEYLPIDRDYPLVPLHLETHPIQARPAKDEPDHWHHDFRYVFISGDQNLRHQESEVNAARWFSLDAPEAAFASLNLAKMRRFGVIS